MTQKDFSQSIRISTGEKLALTKNLSSLFQLKNICISYEILKPRYRSAPPHSHSEKEELIYVLEGELTLWIDGNESTLKSGEYYGFTPGQYVFHTTMNKSESDATYLHISSLSNNDHVNFFESSKV